MFVGPLTQKSNYVNHAYRNGFKSELQCAYMFVLYLLETCQKNCHTSPPFKLSINVFGMFLIDGIGTGICFEHYIKEIYVVFSHFLFAVEISCLMSTLYKRPPEYLTW